MSRRYEMFVCVRLVKKKRIEGGSGESSGATGVTGDKSHTRSYRNRKNRYITARI